MRTKKSTVITGMLAGLAIAAAAHAQSPRDEAYKRGYDEGFERGYQKGIEEGERRARAVVAAPVPPPVRVGPVHVTGAVYGSNAHKCDATRFVAHRADGKMSYSFDVSNEMCGDPSHGDRKELQVTYRCGDVMKTASANEHRTIYLDCRS
jgi:hypothetical protein